MSALNQHAPAKLNLFLAVTGRRTDGFHDLVSVVAPLDFGDGLVIEPANIPAEAGMPAAFTLECSDPTIPADESNLVLKAARAFALATGWAGSARFRLEKTIPAGAGLGGGSSDAAATIRGLNSLAGNPLNSTAAGRLAATVGSDCPLFLHDGPVVMRGRGERIDELPAQAAAKIRGRRVLVFKPAFGIPTPWVYGRLAERAKSGAAAYQPAAEVEQRLKNWSENSAAPLEDLLFNGLEAAVFPKFFALPALLEQLREQFGLSVLMTGSGSACFALLRDDTPVERIREAIRTRWGDTAFVVETKFA